MSDGRRGDLGLLVRAALPAVPGSTCCPASGRAGSATSTGLDLLHPADRRSGASTCAAYAAVCGFPDKDTVPLTYPHVLGFPLHLELMTDPAFPFPAIGTRAPDQHHHHPPADRRRRDRSRSRCTPRTCRPHAKGRTVDFVTDVPPAASSSGRPRRRTSAAAQRRPRHARRPARSSTRSRPAGVDVAAARRPRPPVRRGVRRPQPDPPLPADGEGARLPAADRARHVDQGALPRGAGEPAARRGHRRRGVQEADPAARHGRLRRRPGPTTVSRSRSPARRHGAPHLVGRRRRAGRRVADQRGCRAGIDPPALVDGRRCGPPAA